MKKIIYLIAFLLLVRQVPAQDNLDPSEVVFQPGEELKYRLRYGFLVAAEGFLKVEASDVKFDNRPVHRLVANGKTSGSFDLFYKVRNRYDSYIDRKTLVPYLYTEDIRESNYRRTDKARFYPQDKKIVANKGTFKGKEKTFDLVSAYYFMRNLDLTGAKIGKMYSITYYLNGDVSSLEVQYVGKERIKAPMGYVDCLKFSPSIQPGRVFRKDSKLYVWITDDGNRIPVRAQADILVGSVTMELTSATGLKFPVNYQKN